MSLTALLFLGIVFSGFGLGLFKKPYYALLTYLFIYFICPNPAINWWAGSVPDLRWSLLAVLVLICSIVFHPRALNPINLGQAKPGFWLIAFLLLSLVVSGYAISPDRSYARCYDFFRYVLVFYLMIKCIKTEKELFYVVFLFLFFGFILGYFAYGHPRHSGRLEGIGTPDSANANGLALLFVTLLPFCLPVLFCGKRIFKWCAVLFVVFILNGIVLCNSRGAIVSFAALFVCIFFMSRPFPKLQRNMILIGIATVVAFTYLADKQFIERFNTISESSATDRGSGRLDIWAKGLKMVSDYPFGAGGDGFQLLSPSYMGDELLTAGGVRSSHNTYLQVLVEQGYIGLFLYMGFYLHLFWILRGSRRSLLSKVQNDRLPLITQKDKSLYMLNIATTSALAGHMVGAFLGNRLYYEYVYYLAAIAVLIYYFSADAPGDAGVEYDFPDNDMM